jgi:uncharacterized membrane protein YraQ (UPF0718 family)
MKRRIIDGSFLFVSTIAVAAGAGVWVTKGPSAFLDILIGEAGFAVALLPKVFAGVLIASILPLVIPRERIIRLIGRDSGVRGLVIAALAGAVIPGGPSATIPLVAGLMAAGADAGAGVALVSAWVLYGLNRTLIWELSFLPAHLVGLRVLLCLPVPVLLGLAVRGLGLRLTPTS